MLGLEKRTSLAIVPIYAYSECTRRTAVTVIEQAEHVILVDELDRETGTTEKLDAHQRGVLHRAFSVMIWDRHERLLLQKRHIGKYHSGGLWTNSCCGHPRPGEDVATAAARRLREEMGFDCVLVSLGTIQYRAELDAGLIEHELVHVFRGCYDGAVHPDPLECDGYAWVPPQDFQMSVAAAPQRYSAWFQKYVAAGWPVAAPRA
jgi:isopentenyl-diphosphate Delta-isomerase